MSSPSTVKLFKTNHTSVQADDIKLLESGLFSDVTIIVGESQEEIKAHKFKLVRSPVFATSFERWETEKQITLEIPEVEAEPFRLFLKFLYTDEFSATIEQLPDVLYLADKYDVESLRTLCNDNLKTGKNLGNVVEIYQKATQFRQEVLMEDSLKLMLREGEKLFQAKTFLDFDYELFLKFVQADHLEMEETHVLSAVTMWVKHHQENDTIKNKTEILKSLLRQVRFPLFSETEFTEIALNEDRILTLSELVEVYAYFHSSNEKFTVSYPSPTFISRPRHFSHPVSVNVYHDYAKKSEKSCRQCIQNFGQSDLGNVDQSVPAVDWTSALTCSTTTKFQVDKSIVIKGIEIGPVDTSGCDPYVKYQVYIQFLSLGKGDTKVVASFELTDYHSSKRELLFAKDEEVEIAKNDTYAIKFSISGKLPAHENRFYRFAYDKPVCQITEKMCRGKNVIFRFSKNLETCATKDAVKKESLQCISENAVRSIIFHT